MIALKVLGLLLAIAVMIAVAFSGQGPDAHA
jgi:hypothetical protein